MLSMFMITAGFWLGLAALTWAGLRLTSRMVGDEELAALSERLRAWWSRLNEEEDASRDRTRLATMTGWVVGLGSWLLLGAAALAYLIANRNGPWLISFASLVVHLLLTVPAALTGLTARRAALKLLDGLASREPYPDLLRLRRLLAAIRFAGIGAVVVSFTVMILSEFLSLDHAFLRLFRAVDGSAFLLPLVAVAALPLAHRWVRAGRDGVAWFVMLALAFSLPLIGLQAEAARVDVATSAPTSKYILKRLQSLADSDGDGVASPPFGADCGPDDPTIKPFAPDPPGDGIDQDCDGVDGALANETFTLKPLAPAVPLDRPKSKPNLVLITIDALRADHLGAYGYQRPVSPVFDAYAERGVLFEEAFSQDSGTGPSLWSLMVGKTPFQVKLDRPERFPPRYADSETTLATRLKSAGYQTAAVLCGQVFGTPWWNLRDGFESFKEICGSQDKHQAASVTREALKTWEELSERGPTSMWVHYYDPHGPYYNSPLVDFGTTTLDRYDEEIALTDKHLGPLLEALTTPGKRPTYVVITADHGEGFGEHGSDPHARTLYRDVTRVPLLFLGPDLKARRVPEAVGMHDIAPTWLDLAGLKIPDDMTARSQGRVLFGAPAPAERLVFQENSYSRPRRDAKGVIRGRYHYILDITNGSSELYDMSEDPAERNNLVGTGLKVELELSAAIRDFIPSTHVPANLSK